MIFLKRNEIDINRWNGVVAAHGKGLPYAFTNVLDETTGHCWEAIIDDNYEWIFPLPFNRKFIFKQYYAPYCLQQLGIIGNKMPDALTWNSIISMIKKNSVRSRINLNEQNASFASDHWQTKVNYVLPLYKDYDQLNKDYKKSLQQVLKKKEIYHITIQKDLELTTFLKHYFIHTFVKYADTENVSESYIQECFRQFSKLGMVNTLIAKDQNGRVIAGILYLKTKERIINSLQFADPEYRNLSGPSLLIDEAVKMYAGQPLELDFEGSEIPSISNFYKAFNPDTRHYGLMKIR